MVAQFIISCLHFIVFITLQSVIRGDMEKLLRNSDLTCVAHLNELFNTDHLWEREVCHTFQPNLAA